MASIAPGAWRGGRAWLQVEFVPAGYDAQVGLVYATWGYEGECALPGICYRCGTFTQLASSTLCRIQIISLCSRMSLCSPSVAFLQRGLINKYTVWLDEPNQTHTGAGRYYCDIFQCASNHQPQVVSRIQTL